MTADGNSAKRAISTDTMALARSYGKEHGISGEIHSDDYIFWYIFDNAVGKTEAEVAIEYLSSGAGVAVLLRDLLDEYRVRTILELRKNPSEPISVLEFAAGYGRVTRHFPNAFPGAKVTGCDIHRDAVEFLRSIGFEAAQSSHDPVSFALGRSFDVIFVYSFFTHMPRSTWTAWLRALANHLVENGVMVFTAHGEVSQELMRVATLDEDGFFFHPVSEQKDLEVAEYGNTVTAFDYVNTQLRQVGLQLVQFRQAGAGHHDVYILHKVSDIKIYTDAEIFAEQHRLRIEGQGLTAERDKAVLALNAAEALHAAEMKAVYASTSWRLTGAVRLVSRFLKRS